MIINRFNIKNIIFSSVIFFLYILVLLFVYKYEMNPYLWFDESGQFWIAQGLNHHSQPLLPTGSISDVIVNNHDFNLDPGGYSILLYFWTMVSTNYVWVRSLSLLFFIIAVFAFGYLGKLWTKNNQVAFLVSFVPIIIPMLFYSSVNVRAYSMEVLGCLICIIAIHYLQQKITYKNLILWSLLISLFLTSRYSFIIVAFVTSLYILYLIYKTPYTTQKKTALASAFACPLFLVLLVIYLTALRYQNPDLEALDYLPYINTNWRVITHYASLRHLFYLAVLIWILIRFRNHERLIQYKGLLYVTIGVNILFFIFSCMGMHPWDGSNDRCISMITLVVISITALWSELLSSLFRKGINAQYIIIALICLRFVSYKGDISASKQRENILTEWPSIDITSKKVYVDRWESPSVRYLFEHGKLKGSTAYPQNFTFAPEFKHSYKDKDAETTIGLSEWYKNFQPSFEDLLDYDILVAPELYKNKKDASIHWRSINNQNLIFIRNDQ